MWQDQILQRLGVTEAAKKLRGNVGWGAILGVVIAAAVLTLGIGFAVYHFRMRYHAHEQIRDIM